MKPIVHRLIQVIFYGCLLGSAALFALALVPAFFYLDAEAITILLPTALGIALAGWTIRFIATGQKTFKD